MFCETATSGLISSGCHQAPSTMRVPVGCRVVPGEVDGSQRAAGKVLEFQVRRGYSIDRVDTSGGDGKEFWRRGDGRLCFQDGSDAGDLGVSDVDEEDVGDVGRRGDVHLFDRVLLDEVDGHDLHDAEAQRGKKGGGGVAGAIEIGEAVAES